MATNSIQLYTFTKLALTSLYYNQICSDFEAVKLCTPELTVSATNVGFFVHLQYQILVSDLIVS